MSLYYAYTIHMHNVYIVYMYILKYILINCSLIQLYCALEYIYKSYRNRNPRRLRAKRARTAKYYWPVGEVGFGP